MAKLYANSGDPDQTPHSTLLGNYPFEGLQTKMVKESYKPLGVLMGTDARNSMGLQN